MTEENDRPTMWPPAMFKGFQQATEQVTEQQQEFVRQLFGMGGNATAFPQLSAMSEMATFKTRVQSGGRISIPDAEREALDIEDGDIVQTVVIPVKRNRNESDD